MQRRTEIRRFERIWIEHIVWNAAAAVALAILIVILLCSLRALDQIDSDGGRDLGRRQERARGEFDSEAESQPTRLARVNRPSG